jgi:hypothetical protein
MVGNLNNFVVNGLKEWVKTFVGVLKPINKNLGIMILDNGLDPQFVIVMWLMNLKVHTKRGHFTQHFNIYPPKS